MRLSEVITPSTDEARAARHKRQVDSHRRLRLARASTAAEQYGTRCVCCNDPRTSLQFLDGRKRTDAVGRHGTTADVFLAWLEVKGYPDTVGPLCEWCAKGRRGLTRCPAAEHTAEIHKVNGDWAE